VENLTAAPSIRSRWEAAARLVAASRDLLEARPGARGGDPPLALLSRGWAPFLLSLGEDELVAFETRGHHAGWPARSPPTLVALAERAREVCTLPAFAPTEASASTARARRGETPRKRAQIDAFARLVAPLAARARRVLDVGSGHGHLTRDLAGQLGLPVLGLERDPALAGRARSLSSGASLTAATSATLPTFVVTDVLRDGLALSEGDCVIGLHACGELGELMVTSVARARGVGLVLVGCCPQKRRQTSRIPLATLATPDDALAAALDLPRGLLGLGNLAARDEGVEATRTENLAARERRLALNRLLSEGGAPLRLGSEIDGLNRRTAQRDLSWLVARAFTLRGRPVPSHTVIDEAAAWARVEHARARRLSVPRALLARVLEVYVLLDRAAYLEAHGLRVEVGELFPAAVSPRNLALVAR
jgi:SAM-dependent methyltransferase